MPEASGSRIYASGAGIFLKQNLFTFTWCRKLLEAESIQIYVMSEASGNRIYTYLVLDADIFTFTNCRKLLEAESMHPGLGST